LVPDCSARMRLLLRRTLVLQEYYSKKEINLYY